MQTYSLPFKKGDSILEVGGGQYPVFHPNMDVRPMATVDLVADLNKAWPQPEGTYDGVFGNYIIEHISWRTVKQFINECNRVLKPGGTCVMVTANLLEQARALVASEHWADDLVCMIFGDNDYPENTHRCGFSPEFAARLFGEAGFTEVVLFRHPNCVTDMIIQARKSNAIVTVVKP